MTYTPGLHLLANIHTHSTAALQDAAGAQQWWVDHCLAAGLHVLGQVFHTFPGGGYTGVICLTESHISLHTWPEFGYLTLDIYLSNFKQANEGTSRTLLQRYLTHAAAHNHEVTEVWR